MPLIDKGRLLNHLKDVWLTNIPKSTDGITKSYQQECIANGIATAMACVEQFQPIEAVPIKAISTWLAGYAAPPAYALEAVTEGIDYASIAYTANDLARAWEHHLHTLMDNGLMEEDKGE